VDKSDGNEMVEVSYQVMSDSRGIWTVAFFINSQLLHIIAAKSEIMIPKLDRLFQ
jgi:hypothetical protein